MFLSVYLTYKIGEFIESLQGINDVYQDLRVYFDSHIVTDFLLPFMQ